MKINQEYVSDQSRSFKHVVKRGWQLLLEECIKEEPDDRHIIWVYGGCGNEGKTFIAKSLYVDGWAYIRPSAAKDMNYLYVDQGVEKHVVLDIPRRVNKEHYDAIYDFIECAKDRTVTSVKFRCVQGIVKNNIHVVVMSNVEPDFDKISSDRIVMLRAYYD